MRPIARCTATLAGLLLLAAPPAPAAATATFQLLPVQNAGGYASADAISPDGSVVIGVQTVPLVPPYYTPSETVYAWKNGVLTSIANSRYSGAGGASYDGSVVVGGRYEGAFRWENGQLTPIGTSLYGGGGASDVSWDGATIVGYDDGGAFRYRDGAITRLGRLVNDDFIHVEAVSGDGEVVVGWSSSPTRGWEAYRWEDGVMIGLGDLAGGELNSHANDVNVWFAVPRTFTGGSPLPTTLVISSLYADPSELPDGSPGLDRVMTLESPYLTPTVVSDALGQNQLLNLTKLFVRLYEPRNVKLDTLIAGDQIRMELAPWYTLTVTGRGTFAFDDTITYELRFAGNPRRR